MNKKIDFSIYESEIKNKLSQKRYYHSMQVAAQARALAEKYGADKDKAYLAGMLHDIMKEVSYENTLKYCDENGIKLTKLERNTYKILHGIAGADYIRQNCNINDVDIINSVRYHVTARAGMSLLEKIIYLADFTSDDRDFDGVDNLRAAVQININVGMQTALAFSIKELLDKGNCYIHPNTIEAYNDVMESVLQNQA